ncbi:hypothetical protein N566_25205 [Streptomycetaceae bacterium MP113-05]|nr:hypothetical protein N566_25205 [Streptomycetaceae bacterium MP113-05]
MNDRWGPRAPRADWRHGPQELTKWLFEDFPRTDQRRWAAAYLQGLLATPGKKSLRRMGSTVSASDTAWQSLHQIVNASTWPWQPVRNQLADWCARHARAHALVLAPVVIPKRGQQSAGVHRRFDPATGRTAGCQWALGLFLATDRGNMPVDWRLHLPDRWSDDERLRQRASIPKTERERTLLSLVTDVLDSRIARRRPSLPVVTEAATPGEASALAAALTACGRDFALAVPPETPLSAQRSVAAHRPWAPRPAGEACRIPPCPGCPTTTEPPSAVPLPERQVAPARSHLTGCAPPMRRVPVRRRPGRPQRTWLTSMGGSRLAEATRLVALHDTVAHATEVMASCGLHDFEGRSFPGWHRHMTLVSAASAHRLLETAYARDLVEPAA